MSLGQSSRFHSLGLAKVKSEKGLAFYASALSITIRQGSKMCCQDPRLGCWQNPDEYENAQVLESTRKHQVLPLALTGICFQLPRLCYNLFKQWTHSRLLSSSPVTRIIPNICILFPACTSVVVVQDHLQKWTYHGSHPFPIISKIIHCIVFNKVVHIIHSSTSMSFF